jgi:hypothetical protein
MAGELGFYSEVAHSSRHPCFAAGVPDTAAEIVCNPLYELIF